MMNDTEETKSFSKRRKLLEDFSKLKTLLSHQLEKKYSRELINRIFEKAEKEFDRMIPEIRYSSLKSYNKNPYARLMIFSTMSLAIYFSLRKILKDNKLAKEITTTFFQMNLPGSYFIPIKILTRWMFSRFLWKQFTKQFKN